MLIGQELRALREAKNLSQRDIEHRTGLIRAYTSRVENGHTIPSVGTLEKYAYALGVPLYALFIDGQPVNRPKLPESQDNGSNGTDWRELRRFARAFKRLGHRERELLLVLAQKMAGRHTRAGGRIK
jgi:transcriptional regulator with XRE-family HTH domain